MIDSDDVTMSTLLCPKCGSVNIETKDYDYLGDKNLCEYIVCEDCEFEWENLYVIIDQNAVE